MKALLAAALLMPLAASAGIDWRGDFESGDLSQWGYLTLPAGLSLEESCVYEGRYAGRVEITGDEQFLWQGNEQLNRSEFHHKPADTAEGDDTYFGWSFYLPAPLSAKPHEIGYWESDQSWQQQMRFTLSGTDFSFQKSDATEVFWNKENFAVPGIWHDVTMHIHWSTDAAKGFVKVWLDGEYMGEDTFQTRVNDADRMFTQIGLLRSREDSREVILIDNVREGTSMASIMGEFDLDTPVTCKAAP